MLSEKSQPKKISVHNIQFLGSRLSSKQDFHSALTEKKAISRANASKKLAESKADKKSSSALEMAKASPQKSRN